MSPLPQGGNKPPAPFPPSPSRMLSDSQSRQSQTPTAGRQHRTPPREPSARQTLAEAPDLTGQISRRGNKPLAYGGYSAVWRGTWMQGQSVALKILRIKCAPHEDIKLEKRLRREMKVWVNLNHPHVVPLLGHSMEPEGPALISPFYENGCVIDYLAAHSSADRNLVCIDVAAGVSYLHSRNPPIIHGDIKGANVLIDQNGNAALCDFGLSLALDGGSTGHTSSVFGGSLRYLAPELLVSSARTTATDIYALGCTCMQILFSMQPYESFTADVHIMRAIDVGRPPFQLQEEQMTALRFHPSVLRRTWDKTPSQRPTARDIETLVRTGLSEEFSVIPLDRETITTSGQSSQTISSQSERRRDDIPSSPRTCQTCLCLIKGRYMYAMGGSHHHDCFRCADCKTSLIDKEFYPYPYAGAFYALCEKDLMRREGNVCGTCQNPLEKKEEVVSAAGKKYHLDHYCCKICRQKIPTEYPFATHNGELYCHFHVATEFSSRCSGCGEAIVGIGVEDPDNSSRSLHHDCLEIRTTYELSLRNYMPNTEALRLDQIAYLDHEKMVNKIARRIIKHGYGFEKSAIACFSSASHYSRYHDWGQALAAANKLRQHVNLLCDYPKSLPKGHTFPRQANLRHSEASRRAVKLLDMHVFKHLWGAQQAESPAAKEEAREKIFALKYDIDVVVKELVTATLDGVLTLALNKGLAEAADKLFDQLKAFPREERSPRLRPLPSPVPSSPRGSILGELGDSSIDHFYQYSGELNQCGYSTLSLGWLLDEIRGNSISDARTIPRIIWRREPGMRNHEFLLVQVCNPGRKDVWLRLERAAKRNLPTLLTLTLSISRSRLVPNDSAKIAESQEYLLSEQSTIFSSVKFEKQRPTLVDLHNVLSCLTEESPVYTFHKENCSFFCSVTVDLLVKKFSGEFEDGYALEHAESAPKEREAIRRKWLAME